MTHLPIDTASLFAIAAALGWASGLRLYSVVFLTGLAGYMGWVELPSGLHVLQSPVMLGASGLMLFVEFFADKIPGLDTLWDAVHTVVRIPAGAALAASVFGADQSSWAMAAALMGGTLAATSHIAKATTRAAINTSPEPFTNVGASLVGDSVVPASLWLSWAHPMAFFVALAVALVLMVTVTWLLAKYLRRLFGACPAGSARIERRPDLTKIDSCQTKARMFKKILIANRGEIACRVAATARRMGVRTVAVYSDADTNSKHVLACDEAVHIGASSPKESYLRSDRIIEAAKATGAQAIHPGYGFLSENEDFAQACADAGLVFIGPPASAIKAMGLKAESKRLMGKAGVPLVPGYHGAGQEPAMLRGEADRIGYPVLIKASAGGGGKGMRIVTKTEEFDAALASCKREAINSFGDDAVLIERYVTRPRHIEIQVFGDSQGNCVYLFERDCSVQRRHQKVLEEAPAPGMSEGRRAEMGAAAVAAAKAVGYVGAGTVEFIAEPTADGDLRFFFMEMNTRLQVEHPVTEAITGLDLVEWQLRVASGEPLPLKQHELRIHGHAIEARICAENPDANFLPATGRLDVYRTPSNAASFERADVRFDAGVREGDAISPFYDSMIAKLIVWGADREQALARLDAALAETHIVGLQTNVAFLRRVVTSKSFAEADLDTALIERERAALFNAAPLPIEVAAAGVVAHSLDAERAMQGTDPWSRRDGWRLHGSASRRFDIESKREGSSTHHTFMQERNAAGQTLVLGDRRWPLTTGVRTTKGESQIHDVTLGERRWVLTVYATGERFTVFAPEGSAVVDEFDPIAHSADGAHEGGGLTAPMPGKVVAFLVKPGEVVKQSQPLAVMEAMKMEHTIAAPADGTVEELLYAVGDQVPEGGELLRMKPASSGAEKGNAGVARKPATAP